MREVDRKYVILLTVFIAVMAVLNVISAKLALIPFWFAPVSAGIICYWLTFPITDAVGEVYGKANAMFLVWMGFVANILVLGLSAWAIALEPSELYAHQSAMENVLGSVPLIVIASLTAYLSAQLHDVWAYHFWKTITKGKHMWLRNNLSTISSQLIDSLIFNGIAFYLFGEVDWTFLDFLGTTLAYWMLKLCIAVVDTPLVYVLHYWLTGKWAPEPSSERA